MYFIYDKIRVWQVPRDSMRADSKIFTITSLLRTNKNRIKFGFCDKEIVRQGLFKENYWTTLKNFEVIFRKNQNVCVNHEYVLVVFMLGCKTWWKWLLYMSPT